MSWEEPARTVIAGAMNKATCQLHPGMKDKEVAEMFYDVTPQQLENSLTVVELFVGGGLMALGLKRAGFTLVWANDFDKNAVTAYRHNLGGHIHQGDVNQLTAEEIPDADIISGGPPCQDFSVAGEGKGEAGDRGKLVWSYLKIIEAKQPEAFIFENVKGLITKKHRPTFDALLEKFNEIGYAVSWKLLNAWDFGVAQKRERVFIVGIRKDLGFEFQFPEPLPEDVRTQVLRDVIGDLPEPSPSDYDGTTRPVFDSDNRKMEWEKARHTIRSNGGKPIHPDDTTTARGERPRRFTVRECLRIQSAPDSYIFPETMSLSAMYRVVGNGAPCRVAWYLGKALAEQLKIEV